MSRDEEPLAVVRRAGGIADAATLRSQCSPGAIRRALDREQIVLLRRGRYGVPAVDGAERLAVELTGTITHLSAALAWGWALKVPPDLPHITLPRGRRVSADQRGRAHLHWWDRPPPDLVIDARGLSLTSRTRTVVDCLRTLPFDEALTVADSALRSRTLTQATLVTAAEVSQRTGRQRALQVVRAADGRAANPFESCLRAICLCVEGLDARPQQQIGRYRVDLCDRRLQLVIEADSRTWHAGPDEHDADIRRYTTLVRDGWTVVRFSHSDVMDDPAYVAAVLRDVVARALA